MNRKPKTSLKASMVRYLIMLFVLCCIAYPITFHETSKEETRV